MSSKQEPDIEGPQVPREKPMHCQERGSLTRVLMTSPQTRGVGRGGKVPGERRGHRRPKEPMRTQGMAQRGEVQQECRDTRGPDNTRGMERGGREVQHEC